MDTILNFVQTLTWGDLFVIVLVVLMIYATAMWFLLPPQKREAFLQKLPFVKKQSENATNRTTRKAPVSPKFTIETGESQVSVSPTKTTREPTIQKTRLGEYDEFDPLVIDEEAVILSKKTPKATITPVETTKPNDKTVEFDVDEIDLTSVLKKQPVTEPSPAVQPVTPAKTPPVSRSAPEPSGEQTISREEFQKMRQEIDKLKEQFAELRNEFNKLKDLQSAQAPHNQAIFLAKQGISTAELVERCGISQGEAELIISLYRNSPR